MENEFEVESPLEKSVRLGDSQWDRIISEKHPGMKGKIQKVEQTVKFPNLIKKSYKDPHVNLYFREIDGTDEYFYVVVVKNENGSGFVIKTYMSDNKSGGEILWPH